jgi:hypothetical protein
VRVAQVDRSGGLFEDDRPGEEHIGLGVGVLSGVGRLLGSCHVAGVLYESQELEVGHWALVDPEALDRHLADRRLFRVMALRAHDEGAARDRHHSFRASA